MEGSLDGAPSGSEPGSKTVEPEVSEIFSMGCKPIPQPYSTIHIIVSPHSIFTIQYDIIAQLILIKKTIHTDMGSGQN